MHLIQLQQFFAMGGYAQYVWPAYGLTFFVLLINVLHTRLNHRQLLIQLKLKHTRAHNSIKAQVLQHSETGITKNSPTCSHNLRTK